MSLGELVVIFIVTLIVFGPQKLPRVSKHLAMLVSFIEKQKQAYQKNLDDLIKHETLKENELRAQKAEAIKEMGVTTLKDDLKP